ncbi:MAG TPA: prevent-host-death protein [Verrucomicrobiae bacterium]|nr:prevent-host-death protein [Verrucomicrobiae bacterium]
MKTFTVRELDRNPAKVLDAADREGSVHIKRRDGRAYSLQPLGSAKKITALPDFAARRRAIFPKPIPASQARILDKLIAGE